MTVGSRPTIPEVTPTWPVVRHVINYTSRGCDHL